MQRRGGPQQRRGREGGDANEQQLASIGAAFERVQFEMELVLSAISDFVAAAKR